MLERPSDKKLRLRPQVPPAPLQVGGTPVAGLPAAAVPVPAVGHVTVGRPDDDVRHAGGDLLVAARAAVRLAGRRPRNTAHHPVPVTPGLHRLDAAAGLDLVHGYGV